jgi:hypothetical protein
MGFLSDLFGGDMSGNTATSSDSASIAGHIIGNAMADSAASGESSNVITFEVDVRDVRAREIDICQANTAYQITKASFSSDISSKVAMNQNFAATVSQIADALAKNAASGDTASSSTDLSYYVSQIQNIKNTATQECKATNRQTFIVSASNLVGNHVDVKQENVALSALVSSCVENLATSSSGDQSASLQLKQKAEAKAIGAMFTGIMGIIEMAVLGVVAVVMGIITLMILFTISATGVMIVFAGGYVTLAYLIYSKVHGAFFMQQDRAQTISDSKKNRDEYQNAPLAIQGPFCFAKRWQDINVSGPPNMTGFEYTGVVKQCNASEAAHTFKSHVHDNPTHTGAVWVRNSPYGGFSDDDYKPAVAGQSPLKSFRQLQAKGPDDSPGALFLFTVKDPTSEDMKNYAYWQYPSKPGVVQLDQKQGAAGMLMTAGSDPDAPDGIAKGRLRDLDGKSTSFTLKPFPMSSDIHLLDSEQSTTFKQTNNQNHMNFPLVPSTDPNTQAASDAADHIILPWDDADGFLAHINMLKSPDTKQQFIDGDVPDDTDTLRKLNAANVTFDTASSLRTFRFDPYEKAHGHKVVTGIPSWLLGSLAVDSDNGPPAFIQFANTAMFFATPDRRSMLPVGTEPENAEDYDERMEMRIEKNRDGAMLCIVAYCGLLVVHAVLLWNSISVTTALVLVAGAGGAAALYRMLHKEAGVFS